MRRFERGWDVSRHRTVPWVTLVTGLLLVAGSIVIYVVIYPRPDVVDGPNPIFLGFASFVLAALGGVRLGAALHRWLGNDGRVARVVADLACVGLVAVVTQCAGWLLDPGFFEWGVLLAFVRLVVLLGVGVVVLREVGRSLVGVLRGARARWADSDPPSHD